MSKLMNFQTGTKLGVWSEVKLKERLKANGVQKTFDYTFDYVLMPLGRVSLSNAETISGLPEVRLREFESEGTLRFSRVDGVEGIEDFPLGPPLIVEIMTCSTSGGSKKKGTTIPVAFANAVTGQPHVAPGINFRQVWARMVSQLIVKSEVAIEWGGKTVWLLPDSLIGYITKTTRLNMVDFARDGLHEVNILGIGLENRTDASEGPLSLGPIQLYSGAISPVPASSTPASFSDMIRAPFLPPRSAFFRRLLSKEMRTSLVI